MELRVGLGGWHGRVHRDSLGLSPLAGEAVTSKQVTRVRATPSETAQRVERIAGMMRRNEWRRGETAPELGSEWGLATATVEGLAAEASRVVAREVTDPDRVKEDVSMVLSRDVHRASEAAAFGEVARLADVWTRIVGARAPERHEHAVVVAKYEALQPKQRAQWLRDRAATMLAEADRLDTLKTRLGD